MPRVMVQINEDMERVLSKIENKRKISLNEIINEVLKEYIDELDMKQYNKTLPKKSPIKNDSTK